MANLMIVRGLPGSGKSTFVKNNYPGLFYLETDMMNIVDGEYTWTMDRAKEAISTIEKICDIIFKKKYKMDFALVGVYGNPYHFYHYISKALEHDYNIYIKTINTQFQSIHNLPEETFNDMKLRFNNDNQVKYCLSMFENINDNLDKIHYCEMPKLNFG